MQVCRALQHHFEPVASVCTHRRVFLRPIFRRLTADYTDHHLNRLIEFPQDFCLGWPRRVGKLQRSIPHIPRPHNLSSNVVIQVAREMQHQVAKAVAECEGFRPELLVAQRRRQFANVPRQCRVTCRQARRNRRFQICHKLFLPRRHSRPRLCRRAKLARFSCAPKRQPDFRPVGQPRAAVPT